MSNLVKFLKHRYNPYILLFRAFVMFKVINLAMRGSKRLVLGFWLQSIIDLGL